MILWLLTCVRTVSCRPYLYLLSWPTVFKKIYMFSMNRITRKSEWLEIRRQESCSHYSSSPMRFFPKYLRWEIFILVLRSTPRESFIISGCPVNVTCGKSCTNKKRINSRGAAGSWNNGSKGYFPYYWWPWVHLDVKQLKSSTPSQARAPRVKNMIALHARRKSSENTSGLDIGCMGGRSVALP